MENDTKIFLERLGNRITALRKSKGISQKELALRMYTDKTNLRKLEKGKRNATVSTLLKICDGLEISMSDLFKFD